MQDYEADMDELVWRKRQELLYPPNCSYGVNTGGKLVELRTTCSNEKVRNYHKEFYHLNNLMIIVCGKIDHEQLLKTIEPVEEREIGRVPQHFDRPFQAAVPPLTKEKYARILCPSDEEEEGTVHLAWLGPPASDLYTTSALNVLTDYLTDTAGAPLQKDFVQLAIPFCSSVDFRFIEQTTCEICVQFTGVKKDKLDDIKARFFDKTVAEHQNASAFDMERLGFVIEQSIKRYLTKMETNPSSLISQCLIGHQLYGDEADNSDHLKTRLNEVETLKRLATEPASFWAELMSKTFGKNCACVVGEPNAEAVTKTAKAVR
jgi:Zn-dependent M16 (insulinase) family peptidase